MTPLGRAGLAHTAALALLPAAEQWATFSEKATNKDTALLLLVLLLVPLLVPLLAPLLVLGRTDLQRR